MSRLLHITFLAVAMTAAMAQAREWTDASGHYHLEADMIAFNDTSVVLKKANGDLVVVAINDLSAQDREYLKSEEAERATRSANDAMQTWTLRNGLQVVGRVVDYARRDVVLRRVRDKIYVNDHQYDKLDGVYREMVPRIVAYFEKMPIEGKEGLHEWLVKQKGVPRTFTCEGLLLQLENGDLYGVPFFFFSEQDLQVLRPGWERWKAATEDHEKEQHRFLLESQAQAYRAREQQEMRHMMRLQLQLQAYDAGAFDLWEVMLLPAQGNMKMPLQVVVPGRNSGQAAMAAMQKYPGYVVGPVARVLRRN